ncbi:type IVB secretion system protein IcmH/DotU [Roseovarius ramblicola]|uniref:Type IVB secretion system protein IcmH/DotU n=1 Tax=Roseovarius ramblicola TaxID=2022336 RepID=A0ABV5I3Q2_9RHOB
MTPPPPSGKGGGKGGKPPQKTVIAPLPGAGRARPAPGGQGGGQGTGQGGDAWSSGQAGGQGGGPGAGQGGGHSGARPLPRAGGGPSSSGGGPSSSGGGPSSSGGGPSSAQPPGEPPGQPAPNAPNAPPGGAWGASSPPPSGGGAPRHAWMGSAGQDQFFPDMARPTEETPAAPQHKIPLEQALQSTVTGHAVGDNPLTAAAAGLLMLLGRLRSQVVDMEAMPLMAHVTQEIDGFEARATERGADPQQALVAKYVLCGTADDVVQNLPGTDREVWVQYAMEARFFNRRTSGVGIFQEIEKALADPARSYDLLELMLICLQQGFEGKYRGAPGGDVDLQRIRRQIYETLRRVRGRDDDDISPHWQGFDMAALHRRRGVPLWIVVSLALALLCGGYIGLRVYLGNDSGQVAGAMRALHPDGPLTLARSSTLPDLPAEPEPYVPPVFDAPDQLERIRTALSEDIDAGNLTVDLRGKFIAVTANNLVLFDTGSADIREDFVPIAGRIAEVLDEEDGDIRIVGHTDNVPMSGRGRYANNQELSVARAESVAGVIRPAIGDADRIEVIGRGPDDPVAGNDTPEGRARNRRVEVLVRRDEGEAL